MHACAGWFESDGTGNILCQILREERERMCSLMMCVCVWKSEANLGCPLFFKGVSFSGTWDPLIWLSWLASEPRDPGVSTSVLGLNTHY